MKKAFRILSLLATGLAVVGCQDFENGFSAQEIKNAEYAAHFEKVFGTPDPNQDWSMATLVKANVNLPGLTGIAKMNICTGDPRNSETRLLAQIMLKDGKGSIDFDAIKGSENVFVTVEQDGEYKVFSQYALQNGMLNIGDITPEMLFAAAPLTRAFSGTCPTTQRTDADGTRDYTYFDNVKSTTNVVGIAYNSVEKTRDEWVAWTKENVSWNSSTHTLTNNSPFTDASISSFVKVSSHDFSSFIETNMKSDVTSTTNSETTITWNGTLKTFGEWKQSVIDEYETAPGKYPANYYYNNGNWPFTPESILATTDYNSTSNTFVWNNPEYKSGADVTPAGTVYTHNGKTLSFEKWRADAENHLGDIVSGSYDGVWPNDELKSHITSTSCESSEDGALLALTDESTWVTKDDIENAYGLVYPTFQYLNNVQTAAAPPYSLGTGYSFFGDNMFFAESVSVWDSRKMGVFYDQATMRKMEEGYSIVTTEGQVIELPFVFGCTAYCNQFGYIYYKEEDEANIDPIGLKHFVLIEDGRPSNNIYRGAWGSDGTPVASDDHGAINDWYHNYNLTDANGNAFTVNMMGASGEKNNGINCQCNQWQETGIYSSEGKHLSTCFSYADHYAILASQNFYGTSYRPMFFGADGNTAQGTYEWPAGYKIVFWINTLSTSHGTADVEKLYSHTLDNDHGGEHFNYSLPTINKRLHHDYQGELRSLHDDLETFGQVQTISWTIDGVTFLAFGDKSGDMDLNDMVFMVSAPNSNPQSTVKVAAVKWHLNYSQKHEDNDLFANYSLNIGANYTNPKTSEGDNSEPTRTGYEFVGWSLSDPTASSGNPSISGTVSDENTIHYYAIWRPVNNGVTIRWHYNYDGSHGDHEGASSDVYQTNEVAVGDGYNKPATNPAYRDATKVFKGWAESWDATTVLTESELTGLTASTDKCYYAIWEPAPDPGSDPEPITWILACEDLGGSFDYDFNDVVWSVQTSWSGGTPTTKVKVLAAGGTLGFALKYKETLICNKGNAFTASTTDEQVVNAGASNGVNRTPNEFTLTTAITTISTEWQEFSVVVKDHGGSQHVVQNIKKSTENSKAPQIILLPEEWEWPTELTPINEAYTNFTTWVTNNTAATWENWRTDKVENKTVSRSATHN